MREKLIEAITALLERVEERRLVIIYSLVLRLTAKP